MKLRRRRRLNRSGNVSFPPIADIPIDALAHRRHADSMTRSIIIGTAMAIAVLLAWLAWDGWLYLQRGYSLQVGLAGEPGSTFHTDFPAWRAAVHVLLWLVAIAAIVAYVAGRTWASLAAWLTFATTLAAGIYDVVQYGTIGSPTSIWTVLLLLLVALLATFGRPEMSAEA